MCNKLTINLDAKGRKKEGREKIAEETMKGFSLLLFSSVQGMKYGVVESTVNKIVEPLLKIFLSFSPSDCDSLAIDSGKIGASPTHRGGSGAAATASTVDGASAGAPGNGGSSGPVVMPGFPVRTLQAHPPPPYSPSR